ncbi:YadA-like family protein [Paraburkholderia haematera]|uniref:Autotransporter adhesin SadA n=1 Tax=Paraburkholderia haematera TaxID=2793077 RepID=A0ABM8QRK8_9BURK|nr:YadA-like family protein [Paraburkholderia haematera]CAE6711563.1 Autotransporter adhesin SadA [Paraburkholderia haematera]
MNKIYKSVWCEATGTWVATSETARSKTKRGTARKLALVQAVLAGAALVGGMQAANAAGTAAVTYFDASAADPTVDRNASASGKAAVAAGANALANSAGSTAIGNAAWSLNLYGTAVGDKATASADGATAIGAATTAGGINSVAIGYSAAATSDNSVALGANSTTTADLSQQAQDFGALPSAIAGSAPAGEVSVGSAGQERRVTNVAAGAADTDAVNVSQLKAVDSKIATATANSVQYDATPADKSSVTLAGPASADGGVTGGTTISNVHQGAVSATSTDAINGAQLYAIAGDTSDAYIQQNGSGVKYVRTNDKGLTPDDAHATATGASALGYNAQASGVNSVALGYGAKAETDGSVALGQNSLADRAGTVSVGSAGNERQITNVKAGVEATDAVNVSQLNAVSANASRYFKATGIPGSGDDAIATGDHSVAIGSGADASGNASFAAGTNSWTKGDFTTAVGTLATAEGDNSTALGYKATASAAGSVALGQGSIADRVNTVSVGSAGSERQITNVAAGTEATDAVNLSQLQAATADASRYFKANGIPGSGDDAIATGDHSVAIGSGADASGNASFAAGTNSWTKGDFTTAVGTLATAEGDNSTALGYKATASAAGSVALGQGSIADRVNTVSVGSAGSERQITNVAAGTEATDAVNLSQLQAATADASRYFKANGIPGSGDDAIASGDHSVAIGSGADASGNASFAAGTNSWTTGDFTTAVGTLATAEGDNSTALGYKATASAAGSVALGQGSIADRVNTVSVGSAGAERQITNVAAGTADTDAVNVAQLKAASAQTDAKLNGAVMYDTNADGTVNKNSVTLGGDPAAGGTAIHNVANGVDVGDAVNVGQLNAAIDGVVNNAVVNAANPFFSADGDRNTEGAVSSGTHSIASGANAQATGTNAVAIGANSVASGNNATALGAAANASADNSVALGQGSVADRANTVSVGAAGQERQITNVAAGVQGTDAVNVNQMQQSMNGAVGQANSYTDDQIRSARRDSYGGTASALAAAGLPQAVLPGHGMVAIAGGTYAGQSAMAIGVSQLSETGKWVYKVQGTSDSRGQFGASVGAGMHW